MKQKITTIDGVTYIITAFKGVVGLKHFQKCVKYSGGIASTMLMHGGMEDAKSALLSSLLTGSLAEAFANVDDPDLTQFIVDLTKNTTVNGSEIDFDVHFSMNYMSLFKLIKEVIAFNFDDVFTKLGTSVKQESNKTEN